MSEQLIRRRTKRTAENARIICDCVARGMPFKYACYVAGVGTEMFSSWRREDPAFSAQLELAIAQGVDRRLQKIESASDAGDWRAAAWLLEHCQPEHFAKNRVEVTGADGAPLGLGVSIYLPKKDSAPMVEPSAPPAPLALSEGQS